jgi:hypothetical protein
MNNVLRHYPVNWVDGMKVSKKHFIQTEFSLHDHIKDVASLQLTDYNYGLLPSANPRSTETLDVVFNTDYSSNINVQVTNCRAVTANGCRIDIVDSSEIFLKNNIDSIFAGYNLQDVTTQVFYIVLSVNPFVRVPFGEPAIDETPPRHPFTRPEYVINILPDTLINAEHFHSSHLVIGKLFYNNKELTVVDKYIPPCMAVTSHPALYNWFTKFTALTNSIQDSSYKIIHKIKLKNTKNSLSDSVYFLTDKLLSHFAYSANEYKWLIPHQPPVMLLNYLARFGQVFKSSLDFFLDAEREELLAYFGEWADLAPGTIETRLHTVVNLQYQHMDIVTSLQAIQDFYTVIDDLFLKLSQLEFIGKRRGTEVFINEIPVISKDFFKNDKEKPKTKFSPLS